MAQSRRLAAVMFTDIVDYTAIAQGDESSALRLVEEHNHILRALFPRFHGREVKSMGDGFLVEFDSALEATNCAVEIQRALREYNRTAPDPAKIRVRIGIHLGDVVHSGTDILGDAVNVASRLQPLAEAGGVCVSAQVYAQVENKLSTGFEHLGPQQLKNVRLPVDVYRVAMPWQEGAPSPSSSSAGRLAVLPFVNMSPDPNDEFFADGMTEELIGKLSELRGLKVIARTSVMGYKHKDKRLADIGRELGVEALIEGSVRRSGPRVRVRVQLVDARSEEHRWASTYDESLDDIFAIQSDVSAKVAQALSRDLVRTESGHETPDIEAYTDYLRGKQLLHEDSPSSLREAIRLFDAAMRRDPGFARAYVGLARAWAGLVQLGEEEWVQISAKVEPFALRAVELAPDSADAHAALAMAYTFLDRFRDVVAELEKAIALNPNLAEAYETLALEHASAGELEAAVRAERRAYELNPLLVRTAVYFAWLAQFAGFEEEARAALTQIDRAHPGDPRVADAWAEFYRIKGDLATAERILREGLTAHPRNQTLLADLAVVCILSGRRAEAEEFARRAEADQTESSRQATRLYVSAALGDLDEAFRSLAELAKSHSWPAVLGVHSLFRELRQDPRYAQFLRSVGLSPSPEDARS